MRHWSLIRMLWNALQLPFNFSNLLAGGIRKSATFIELFISLSFRLATSWISRGNFLETSPFQIFSVSLFPKEIITPFCVTNAKSKYFENNRQTFENKKSPEQSRGTATISWYGNKSELLLFFVFHFFIIYVWHVFLRLLFRASCVSSSTRLLRCVVDILRGSIPSVVQGFQCFVNCV